MGFAMDLAEFDTVACKKDSRNWSWDVGSLFSSEFVGIVKETVGRAVPEIGNLYEGLGDGIVGGLGDELFADAAELMGSRMLVFGLAPGLVPVSFAVGLNIFLGAVGHGFSPFLAEVEGKALGRGPSS